MRKPANFITNLLGCLSFVIKLGVFAILVGKPEGKAIRCNILCGFYMLYRWKDTS
jgi:hypothetical protein